MELTHEHIQEAREKMLEGKHYITGKEWFEILKRNAYYYAGYCEGIKQRPGRKLRGETPVIVPPNKWTCKELLAKTGGEGE